MDLKPCPRCKVSPNIGYCCGEYFVSGPDPDCPICGISFTEMHSSEQAMVDAWNGRIENMALPENIEVVPIDHAEFETRYLGKPFRRAHPAWVSVTEGLPKLIPCSAGTSYSEAVNVLTSGRKVLTAIWTGEEFICDAEFWEAEGEAITHWAPVPLPLPDPPEVVK